MTYPTHIVAVGGVVENNNGEILLVRQRDSHDKSDPAWVCPGGQVENGENLLEALVREIKEESGANVEVNKLHWIGSNTGSHESAYGRAATVPTKVILDFTCTYVDGELTTSDETSEVRWVKKEDVSDMLTPLLRARFQAYLDFDGGVRYDAYTSRPYSLNIKQQI
ncbi:MAG: NUDIX hydrolase [Defluviitaleaceae bacterium]|nr:NUDIX hydrolase [Defluviitaleaceae bacterium]